MGVNWLVPGIPGRFRFFLAVDLGGWLWLPEEETLASPEAVEELSKSTGMDTENLLLGFSLDLICWTKTKKNLRTFISELQRSFWRQCLGFPYCSLAFLSTSQSLFFFFFFFFLSLSLLTYRLWRGIWPKFTVSKGTSMIKPKDWNKSFSLSSEEMIWNTENP